VADDVPTLKNVVVRASLLDENLPARTVIGPEEFTSSNKSQLSNELELTPGLNVRVGGRGEPRIDMRGYDQRSILFTLNGVPIIEPYNGITNPNLFPLDALAEVETVRGPSSTLYGPNGVAGTIKLTTAEARAPFGASLTTLWREHDFWDVRPSGSTRVGPWSAVVAGRYLSSDGFPLSGSFDDRPPTRRRLENGGLRLNSDQEYGSAFADVGYQLGDATQLRATYVFSNVSFGLPPSTTQFLPQFLRSDREELQHVHTGIEHRIAPNVRTGVTLFYSGYDTTEAQYDSPSYDRRILTTWVNTNAVGAISHTAIDLSTRQALAVALQGWWSEADVSNSSRGGLVQPDIETVSSGVEHVFYLTDWAWTVTGFSLDLQTGSARSADWQPNPQGGVVVDTGVAGTARAAISRKVRFPTMRELFDPRQGNTGLNPETVLTFEVGDRFQRGPVYLELSLYRSEVTDLIDANGASDDQRNVNLNDAVLQGIEVAAGAIAPLGVRLDANYTFLDATAKNPVTGSWDRIQNRPRHRFNGILRVPLPYQFAVRLEGIYASSHADQLGSSVTVDGFGLFNAQLSRPLGPFLVLFGGVNNLLDQDYDQKLGQPQSGRWGFAGLRATY
jgi:outer membrane receptor protein involved in Fe transport